MFFKHYVAFLFPNDPTKVEELFEIKVQIQEVENRDFTEINSPANAYAFYFFDRFEEIINGEYLIGKSINHSMIFYLGPAYTFEEIETQFPEEANELSPIFQNKDYGITLALRTCYNSWIFLKQDAIIL